MRLGAADYLSKPVSIDDLLNAFARLENRDSARPAPELRAPSLARAEWEHMHRVISDCGGNISEAARRLGMHRRSLQRKLQKHPPRE
jgi:two-component system response regulator RegA